ncbi:MAG: methionyl-tRNA formyltransferase [Bacteroidaceae bacterium]|nr:methionyl-tRNA formyltransferase [Bacteroidaceae bacterium]
MERKSVRIVFMGTPEFAEFSLRSLVEEGFNVVGVVTVPDRAIGRHGSVLQPSPVKSYAQKCGIPVLQPEKLKDEAFLTELRALEADLQIVVAFRMLPEVVWAMPRMGTFNLHASLLPQYRGAAPINWAVINGDRETGVTTFFLKHEIDTGDIIDQVRVPILDDDDVGTVHDRLMKEGAALTVKTADMIIAGIVTPKPQPVLAGGELRPAPKIFKDTCRIDWRNSPVRIRNFVRGLSPYPAAWSVLVSEDGVRTDVKIFSVSCNVDPSGMKPGEVSTDGKTHIDVCTGENGSVRLLEIQVAGKKRMSVKAFLCGSKLSDCCFFE